MATTAGTTEALVQSTCNMPVLGTAVITPHLATAEARAKARIGTTIYAAIVAATGGYGAADLTALKRGEALLCGAIAVSLSNFATAGTGVFGATVNAGGDTTPMVSETRLESIVARLESLAVEALAPYVRDYVDSLRADSDDELPDSRTINAGRIRGRASS